MSVYKSMLGFATFVFIFAQGISGQITAQGCPLKDYRIVPNFEQIKAGEIVELEIMSKDGPKIECEFQWTVSIGEIISGQGTSEIQVRTPVDALAYQTPKLPPSDEHGWILIGPIGGRRTVPLKITVRLGKNTDCNEQELSTRVQIGKSSIVTNQIANVTELILEKTEVSLSCQTNTASENAIDISVKAEDRENDVLTYEYTVSDGKIVGQGPHVKWDLSGVAPGVYSITAGVNDGCGICGKTVTKTVTIGKCP